MTKYVHLKHHELISFPRVHTFVSMLRILLISALTLLWYTSAAQNPYDFGNDVVYFKNGSIIKGAIVEMELDGNIKIETLGGSVFVYKMSEVQRIEKGKVKEPEFTPVDEPLPEAEDVQEPPVEKEPEQELEEDYFGDIIGDVTQPALGKTTGLGSKVQYRILVGGGVLIGDPQGGSIGVDGINTAVSHTLINTFQFKDHYSVGVGFNLETFRTPLMPFFIDLRYTLGKKKTTPYAFAQGGIALPLFGQTGNNLWGSSIEQTKGGFMFECGIGLKQSLGTIAIMISAGYRYQLFKYTRIDRIQDPNAPRNSGPEVKTLVTDIFSRFPVRVTFQI